jgi:hypothetical protein
VALWTSLLPGLRGEYNTGRRNQGSLVGTSIAKYFPTEPTMVTAIYGIEFISTRSTVRLEYIKFPGTRKSGNTLLWWSINGNWRRIQGLDPLFFRRQRHILNNRWRSHWYLFCLAVATNEKKKKRLPEFLGCLE